MRITRFLSIILHPIFIPIIAFMITLYVAPKIKTEINDLLFCYGIMFLGTILMPVLILLLLLKRGTISSIEMSIKKERSMPLLITGFCVLLSYYQLKEISFFAANSILYAQIIGVIIIIFSASIISNFWKISLHMLGFGGLTGILTALYFIFNSGLYILIISMFFSVFLGVSRFRENAHNKKQIYMGFCLGLLIELMVVMSFQYYADNFYFSF